jgi:hypothetical protein
MRPSDSISAAWDVVELHVLRNPRKYTALGFIILVLPQAVPAAVNAAKWLWSFIPVSATTSWSRVWAMSLPFSWNWITTPLGLSFMALVWWETRKHRLQPDQIQPVLGGPAFLMENDTESQDDYESALGERNAALNQLQQRTTECDALKTERDGAREELRLGKRRWASERLKFYSEMTFDGTSPTVTIRIAEYADYKLAQSIESVFKEFTPKWAVRGDVPVAVEI